MAITNNLGLTLLESGSYYDAEVTNSNLNKLDAAVGAATVATAVVSLTASGWSGNAKTIAVTGVTANNTVIVAPAPASQDAYVAAGILCTAQAAGTLTFHCTALPGVTLSVNVIMIGGRKNDY